MFIKVTESVLASMYVNACVYTYVCVFFFPLIVGVTVKVPEKVFLFVVVVIVVCLF